MFWTSYCHSPLCSWVFVTLGHPDGLTYRPWSAARAPFGRQQAGGEPLQGQGDEGTLIVTARSASRGIFTFGVYGARRLPLRMPRSLQSAD